MLAWGKNFMPLTNLFIDYFPGYNKFRSVTFILVISQFCIPLLGVLALRDLFKSETPKKDFLKAFTTAAVITGGVLLAIMLIPGFAGSFLNPYESQYPIWLKSALIADRKHLLERDTLRSFVFIILATGTILAFMYEKLRKDYAVSIIGLLILFDLWTVDRRYLNSDNFQNQTVYKKSFSPTAADSYILKDPSYFRVWNHIVSTFNDNSPTSYFHKSIGGYNGAKMKRYQELIDSAILRDMNVFNAVGENAKTLEEILPAFDKTYTLNMLNTKYIIFNPDAPPIVNPKALGNAWFVEKPEIVENADMELSMTGKTDPSKIAVIDKRFHEQVTKTAYPTEDGDKIELLTYQPNELVYKSSARSEKLALFSEIYYPAGWKCFVDGKESKYFRANYVLRAMIVPGGNHEIRFTFKPSSYYTGNTVSLASSVILILLFAGYAALKLKKK
jgi:hypothetical protein